MFIFRIKSEPNGDGNRTSWVILEHALLWMRDLPYRPGFSQVCIRGGESKSDECTVITTDETVDSIMNRSL